eukprot:4677440-Amphidinium_carterae.1
MGTRGVPIGTGSPGTSTGSRCGSAATLAEYPGTCRKRASRAAGTFQQVYRGSRPRRSNGRSCKFARRHKSMTYQISTNLGPHTRHDTQNKVAQGWK